MRAKRRYNTSSLNDTLNWRNCTRKPYVPDQSSLPISQARHPLAPSGIVMYITTHFVHFDPWPVPQRWLEHRNRRFLPMIMHAATAAVYFASSTCIRKNWTATGLLSKHGKTTTPPRRAGASARTFKPFLRPIRQARHWGGLLRLPGPSQRTDSLPE
jgi:hypothetical protein